MYVLLPSYLQHFLMRTGKTKRVSVSALHHKARLKHLTLQSDHPVMNGKLGVFGKLMKLLYCTENSARYSRYAVILPEPTPVQLILRYAVCVLAKKSVNE